MTKQEFFLKHGAESKDKACSDALDWIDSLPKTYNGKQIWRACRKPHWMLWYLKRTVNKDDPRFRLLACALVRRTPIGNGKTTWDLLTDERSKRAVEVAELYAVGKATSQELTDAYAGAWSAADAAYADAAYADAYAAAWSAADAAAADTAAAWATATVRDAAYAAYTAATAARYEQCNIIREYFKEP